MKVLAQKSIKIISLATLLTDLFVLMINLANQLLSTDVKMLLICKLKNEAILEENEYCKRIMKKYLNKKFNHD